jgi:hypothetical protein
LNENGIDVNFKDNDDSNACTAASFYEKKYIEILQNRHEILQLLDESVRWEIDS